MPVGPHAGTHFVALLRDVRAELGQEHRYAHCVRVARLAGRLAQRHGEEPERARLAGLLHDLARLYDNERLLRECEARGFSIEPFERRYPIVLHARLSAELARERFGVEDSGILSAIRAHTLGAPHMSRLDAIVYLADGLEPGRAFAERRALEALAFSDWEAAMGAVLRASVAYLRGRNLEAAPATLAALASFEGVSAAAARNERRPLPA
ncbi:MAG: bis(5'-nucleosyl)-tetraphosphatase (symmetrical) YqeK [Candidatus Eremiobacteraeota bacterium]|nr:bis(5'-nucleosyl)-tetraphosphatase (symmetrical) YqeK [Candidatus Eremiobacteraeota bacterium]